MTETIKKYSTIGCCGIDCGLCPQFHTKADSVCPGCGGLDFKKKHPSCGCMSCCAVKNGFEVCSVCNNFPCSYFDVERQSYDSFVTHKKVFENLDYIKTNGMDSFINQQKIRISILKDFLSYYDDGRSKSFFCISCALLPLDKLQEAHNFITNLGSATERKEKNKQLKEFLQQVAENLNIELRLNKKKSK